MKILWLSEDRFVPGIGNIKTGGARIVSTEVGRQLISQKLAKEYLKEDKSKEDKPKDDKSKKGGIK